MAFPTSPTNGQIYKEYIYNSTVGSWKKTQAIYDSGSNANGSWIRYADGTMQVWKNITVSNVALTNVQGNMFYSTAQNLGSWSVAFINDPTITCTIRSTYDIWATATTNTSSTTNAGNWYAWTNTSRPSDTIIYMVQAIGRWK